MPYGANRQSLRRNFFGHREAPLPYCAPLQKFGHQGIFLGLFDRRLVIDSFGARLS